MQASHQVVFIISSDYELLGTRGLVLLFLISFSLIRIVFLLFSSLLAQAIEGNWTPDLFITNEVLCH